MTNNQNVETVTSKSDIALVTLAVLCAIAGVVAFALLTEQPLSIRLASLGGGLVLGVLLAWVSPSGKRLLAASCGLRRRKRSTRPALSWLSSS